MDEARRKAASAAHAREQLRAWSRLTYQQRLDWLWEAKLFAARAMRAAEERRRSKVRAEGQQ